MGLFDKACDALEDLFERERAAIMAGRFDILERLSAEKERLFSVVLRQPDSADGLARLRALADRNRNLLGAMESGVRAAARRIERLGKPLAGLNTYDATGQRHEIADSQHNLHRRA